MLTKKAIVDKTITFKNEERVPIWVDGPSIGPSDVLTYDLSLPDPNDPRKSEWGFKRARAADGNWIVPKEGTLTAWDQVDAFRLPEHDFQRRFRSILAAAKVGGDRYRLASFGLSGYSIYSAIRGANLCYDDCLRDFDRFTEFFEKIVEFETSMFDTIARKGFHGVEFCDDWGPRSVSRITLSFCSGVATSVRMLQAWLIRSIWHSMLLPTCFASKIPNTWKSRPSDEGFGARRVSPRASTGFTTRQAWTSRSNRFAICANVLAFLPEVSSRRLGRTFPLKRSKRSLKRYGFQTAEPNSSFSPNQIPVTRAAPMEAPRVSI